ncbi:hypothetical protein WR25_08903 [Diploscapter pachys]|uniref:Uncharacterized protein n=1 Tax=Diploscapter pachys TaxID=2018661 RepID=A0A2A2JX51_9BILA|nr:hypothetical protein WR25_08903 [Diploscapter pachys]
MAISAQYRLHWLGTERLARFADLAKCLAHDAHPAGQGLFVALAYQRRQAACAGAVLPPDVQAKAGQLLQPRTIDPRRQLAGAERADMQGLVQLPVESLQLRVQRIAPGRVAKVQVVQFHGQVPAGHRQRPFGLELLVLGERASQLRLEVTVQAFAVELPSTSSRPWARASRRLPASQPSEPPKSLSP